jgi:hypothetical protein
VNGLPITCVSCGRAWAHAAALSVYEQQAVESCPCPQCGAYTLCWQEPDAEPVLGGVRRAPAPATTARR